MSRAAILSLSAVAIAGTVWATSQGVLPQSLEGWTSDAGALEAPATVLVVLVPNGEGVAAVRRAVSADRVVATSAEGVALREGRIVAASHEAASELIGRAGWVDARIEILTPGARAAASSGGEAAGARDSELSALAKKPTLSPAEAMRVLELLQ